MHKRFAAISEFLPGMGAYSKNYAGCLFNGGESCCIGQFKTRWRRCLWRTSFLLSALTQYTAVAGIASNSGNFGLGYFGYTNYNETQLGLAYGRLEKKVDVE